MRSEYSFGGMTKTEAFDGKDGWSSISHGAHPGRAQLSGTNLDRVKARADYIEGDLVHYRQKGHSVELVGKEDVEGTEAYKLKVTRADGNVSYYYLDTEYYLVFKKEGTIVGGDTGFVSLISNYKKVGDILVAHNVETTMSPGAHEPKAHGTKQWLSVESMQLNTEIDDSRFSISEASTQ